MEADNQSVIAYRIERLRRAPRNWAYWIAAFTAANGIFIALAQEIMIPAGLVLPFSAPGSISHFISAALVAAAGYFSSQSRVVLYSILTVYVIDAFFSAYAGLWSGTAMHAVVLMFIGFAVLGVRHLRKQLAMAKTN